MQLLEVVERLAELGKDLTCAEFRVLHLLITCAYRAESQTAKISSRELARVTGLARSNVQTALDSLTERNLIANDQGSSTRAAAYRLAFLDVVVLNKSLVRGPNWPYTEISAKFPLCKTK